VEPFARRKLPVIKNKDVLPMVSAEEQLLDPTFPDALVVLV